MEQFLNTALIIGRAMFPRINLLALGAHLNVRFTQSLSKPKDCFVPLLDCRGEVTSFARIWVLDLGFKRGETPQTASTGFAAIWIKAGGAVSISEGLSERG